jgi:predicted dehydrogenase
MLVEMDEEIEAVTVSTPDHTHFAAAMMAIEMGKHVYVQKPMTRTIWEARRMTEAARRHRVSTQMGNQGHSNEWARLMKEWVEAGAIGDVTEVHFWSDRPIWPQGMSRPAEIQPVPPHLDWNLWLGTAPERPYNSAYCPFKWRGWWDFGCGALGDMGCHIMDAAFYALELGSPVRVEAETSPRDPESAPEWSIVTYHFPARGSRPPVKAVWYDGGKRPPRPAALEEGRDLMGGGNGSYLVGEKGGFMADCYCGSARIFPESLMEDFQGRRPEKTLPRSKGGHYQNWIQSCKEGGEPACSNFDYAGPLTEMVLLGNLAVRTGMPIEWDGKRMRVTNYPEANRYVREAMRKF